MNPIMIACPACGKWLKHAFALGGHIRLKGDDLHRIYFETHKIENPKKESTDLEKQVKELITVVKQNMEDTKNDSTDKEKQVRELINLFEQQSKNLNDMMLKMTDLIVIFSKHYEPSTIPIKQKEVMVEKPVTKAEKPEIKEEKIRTVAEIIKEYGSFDNAVEYVDRWTFKKIIEKDKEISSIKRYELMGKVDKKWLEY